MDLQHKTQRDIILKLIHNPQASFSDLCDEPETNRFAYHLSTLENKGLIKKTDGKYSLSNAGQQLSSFIEGDTGNKAAFPTFTHVLIVQDGDKILAQRRLKEPFYGYWGLISGKINFGWNVEECALRDITEECGLKAKKSELIGINQAKTFQDGKLHHHHIMFYVRLSGISGNIQKQTHKGHNAWMTIKEFKQKERFPDPWFDAVLNAKSFVKIETERFLKDGKFVDCKLTNVEEIK